MKKSRDQSITWCLRLVCMLITCTVISQSPILIFPCDKHFVPYPPESASEGTPLSFSTHPDKSGLCLTRLLDQHVINAQIIHRTSFSSLHLVLQVNKWNTLLFYKGKSLHSTIQYNKVQHNMQQWNTTTVLKGLSRYWIKKNRRKQYLMLVEQSECLLSRQFSRVYHWNMASLITV